MWKGLSPHLNAFQIIILKSMTMVALAKTSHHHQQQQQQRQHS
jgi:hypothetical protein